MPFEFSEYYYIILILQAICVIHCLKKGNQSKWIWLIVFVPVIGSIAYLFTEVFNRNDIGNVQSGINSVIFPAAKIKKLESNLVFSDTFNNRIALADAYLASGQIDKAIALYEESIAGTFVDHEHANMQLMAAYFEKGRYADVVNIGKKINQLPQFARSRVRMQYAISLSYIDKNELAEIEFKAMNGRFSNYESRFEYGKFLIRNNRSAEAAQIFKGIMQEASHLSSNERRNNRVWFGKVNDELKKITTQ